MVKQVAAPAPVAAPVANTPKVATYVAGPKVPHLRTAHTQLGWDQIVAVLAANPNGATMAQIIAATTPNVQFGTYAVTRQWLAKVA